MPSESIDPSGVHWRLVEKVNMPEYAESLQCSSYWCVYYMTPQVGLKSQGLLEREARRSEIGIIDHARAKHIGSRWAM